MVARVHARAVFRACLTCSWRSARSWRRSTGSALDTMSAPWRLIEVIEFGDDLLPEVGHVVEPVVLVRVDSDAGRGADPERIFRRQLGGNPYLEALGEPNPVLRLGDRGQIARGSRLPLIHSPTDCLHHGGEDPPRIGVQSEADALAGPHVLQAVLAVVGHDPEMIAIDTG